MHPIVSGIRRSVSLKVATVGFLILLMLIPVSMIKGVISERRAIGEQAKNDIMRSWGGMQNIAGPILVLPYDDVRVSQYGEKVVTKRNAYLLPKELDFSVDLKPEMRYRGLHRVPIYSAIVRATGTIDLASVNDLDIDTNTINWRGAYISLAVSDARAITETPEIVIGSFNSAFAANGQQIVGMPPQIVAPIGELFEQTNLGLESELEFSTNLAINGTDSLRFLPLGDTTTVSMKSAWPAPSFVGNYLPRERQVSDAGFEADWRISSLGRALPSRWISGSIDGSAAMRSAFGVDLYIPIGLYQLTVRATKYAILFIALTFAAYFLFEIVGGLRLHPLQYLLIGFANSLFYLLLLSLAEHVGFGWAYLVSALASSALIVGYSFVVLVRRSRAISMSIILFCLYSFLYMTLQAESYAMLAGSLGLWVSLAAIMYLTRRVDWYGKSEQTENSAASI